ncbi:2'-5' RNA ligase family protein, partial [Longispora fulva]|uniref:2'-5' RNA ligase family protein n=2 Tax=Bacteria TaxID=2 RepID=UPI003637D102
VSHALKLPAHVTLQIPFHMNPMKELKLEGLLSSFSERHKAFPVKINGFGAFKPRVIYLKVEDHAPFIELHKDLQPMLAEELELLEREVTSKIHPHFTVATRDLKNAIFKEAWPQLEAREFKAEFTAQKISLLKHNGKTWDILKEFPLKQ